ncbi:hypothetical protein N7447_001218 [Penicillium robsamsonii]|uniref:uncharacterized protein n=1 Tax=Penicillium robsamsonii TaxID=1792511 RepID=UPI0025494A3E|nr:uncharacterized protein N7447_001218 [Penicillium robsamsonii]KAJ5835192.1 hypothetical protein N7447_001218 [Penicillium robsamsonii]
MEKKRGKNAPTADIGMLPAHSRCKISTRLTFSVIVGSFIFPRVAGAAVTTITNPQNLTSLFITHDFGLYPWSFCFMLGICVSRIPTNFSKLDDVLHHSHISLTHDRWQMIDNGVPFCP